MSAGLAPLDNNWSCLPKAFALALEVDFANLIRKVGHDGSEIVRPELPEPYCRRSFHIQEMIDYTTWLGYSVTPIEAFPRSVVDDIVLPLPGDHVKRMVDYLSRYSGVLTGQGVPSGRHHAVAWKNGRVLDPAGVANDLNDFAINTFWIIDNFS